MIPFRNPHVQTILGSSRLRALGSGFLVKHSEDVIIDAGQGVRLSGIHSTQPGRGGAKGFVALLHGWEGSSASSYIRSLGAYLFKRGYDIFRLNLRDHGDSHYLNEGLFHGALTEETATAIGQVSLLADGRPFFVMGFSLGGNYALRIALRQKEHPIANLKHVIAVSPALDPLKSTRAIDESSAVYRLYFLKKWKDSLRKKEALFPGRYDFSKILSLQTCMGMTEAIMPYYPEFPDYKTYFGHYTLLDGVFADLRVPVSVVTSQDDPVVPVADFRNLAPHPNLTLHIHRYGGHCGFFECFPAPCWHEQLAFETFERYCTPA